MHLSAPQPMLSPPKFYRTSGQPSAKISRQLNTPVADKNKAPCSGAVDIIGRRSPDATSTRVQRFDILLVTLCGDSSWPHVSGSIHAEGKSQYVYCQHYSSPYWTTLSTVLHPSTISKLGTDATVMRPCSFSEEHN